MTEFVNLPMNTEVLTLFNVKPTAIVTTIGKDGSANAAPYTWFSIVDYNPPQLLLSSNMKRDTYRNILETGEFVLNFPSVNLLEQIWVTSKHFPYGVSEIEKANLTSFPSEKVKPPRIKECKAHIECRVLWTKPIGSSCLILAEIVSISASRELSRFESAEKLLQLNPPLYFSFTEDTSTRKWMFAEIARIHNVTERDQKVEVTNATA